MHLRVPFPYVVVPCYGAEFLGFMNVSGGVCSGVSLSGVWGPLVIPAFLVAVVLASVPVIRSRVRGSAASGLRGHLAYLVASVAGMLLPRLFAIQLSGCYARPDQAMARREHRKPSRSQRRTQVLRRWGLGLAAPVPAPLQQSRARRCQLCCVLPGTDDCVQSAGDSSWVFSIGGKPSSSSYSRW